MRVSVPIIYTLASCASISPVIGLPLPLTNEGIATKYSSEGGSSSQALEKRVAPFAMEIGVTAIAMVASGLGYGLFRDIFRKGFRLPSDDEKAAAEAATAAQAGTSSRSIISQRTQHGANNSDDSKIGKRALPLVFKEVVTGAKWGVGIVAIMGLITLYFGSGNTPAAPAQRRSLTVDEHDAEVEHVHANRALPIIAGLGQAGVRTMVINGLASSLGFAAAAMGLIAITRGTTFEKAFQDTMKRDLREIEALDAEKDSSNGRAKRGIDVVPNHSSSDAIHKRIAPQAVALGKGVALIGVTIGAYMGGYKLYEMIREKIGFGKLLATGNKQASVVPRNSRRSLADLD